MTDVVDARAHILYRMYDRTDQLLYIGITVDARARWEAHAEEKTWWPDVATIRLEHFADRESVERAERRAIQNEHPRYNVVHRRSGEFDEELAILAEVSQLVEKSKVLKIDLVRRAKADGSFRLKDIAAAAEMSRNALYYPPYKD